MAQDSEAGAGKTGPEPLMSLRHATFFEWAKLKDRLANPADPSVCDEPDAAPAPGSSLLIAATVLSC